MIWDIIWWLCLPFIAVYNILKKGSEDMTETQATFYYFFLVIVTLQIIEVITNL